MGDHSTASEYASTAMGFKTKASGIYSIAMGRETNASNIASTALGGWTIASGTYSTAMGRDTTASGNFSTAIGRGIIAYGDNSIGIGLDQNYPYWNVSNDNVMSIMGGKVGIGTTSPNSPLEVNGTIHSTSGGYKFPDDTTQTTAATGHGAIAFANIRDDGFIRSGSPNVISCIWTGSHYEIEISGESYHYTTHTTVVTTIGNPYVCGTDSVGGKLVIEVYDNSGSPIQPSGGFQFVTYK
jgi:hypothetical protein